MELHLISSVWICTSELVARLFKEFMEIIVQRKTRQVKKITKTTAATTKPKLL